MLSRRLTWVAAATLGVSAAAAVVACSKDDKDDTKTTPLTAEQKVDGNKAAVASLSSATAASQNGSNLRSAELRRQLRAMYAQARSRRAAFNLQDGATTNLCDASTAYCQQTLNAEQDYGEGMKCTTTSCTSGQTQSCTQPGDTATCGDITYTFADYKTTTNVACAKVDDSNYNYTISADMTTNISGGSITTAMALACKVKIVMPISIAISTDTSTDSDTSTDDDLAIDCTTGSFTCTLGGNALSCEDIKALAADTTCK
jgi:hypothetical protein